MIELKTALIAEYAVTAEGKLTVAGTFDTLDVSRRPGVTPDALTAIAVPRLYLAIVTEASLLDGLRHTLRVRILNGAGEGFMEEILMPFQYVLNNVGRRMRSNIVLSLNGLTLPGCDDYVFEICIAGDPATRLGEAMLSIVDRTPADG